MARVKTHRGFTRFLKLTLGRFLIRRYRLRAENLDYLKSLKPPYFVLPNHVSFWDPFIVANFVPEPVNWVVSDVQFRRAIMRLVLGLVGSIPKTKAVSDFETVRNIYRVIKGGGVIGIFAEGRRNWDGHSMPPLLSAAKLIKALKVPVVVPILKGAFLTLPRWAAATRNGQIVVEFRNGLSQEEINHMSVEEIYARLSERLEYDEMEFQKKEMIRFKSKRSAEGVERALYVCPECRSIGSLRSSKMQVRCVNCSFDVMYSEYGFFEKRAGEPPFRTVRDWSLWQVEYLRTYLLDDGGEADAELFSENEVTIWKGYRRDPLQKLVSGELKLTCDGVECIPKGAEPVVFPIDKITGVNVQLGEYIEFYQGESMYSVRFAEPWASGLKWMVGINILKGIDVFSPEGIV